MLVEKNTVSISEIKGELEKRESEKTISFESAYKTGKQFINNLGKNV
ncbi:MAG: hypothetical protein GY828_04235 [Candidatus Gracilibacteria bacterium]|nr:hypothetical protein [Candidatus Gracilibacteria bacterium]